MQELGPNQKAWLAALRSGDYEQGMEYLCKEGDDGSECYCCLGVACVLIGVGKSRMPATHYFVLGGEISWAPIEVVQWLGLRSNQGDSARGNKSKSLAWLNDHGVAFERIADIIEADPSQYFTEPR